VRACIVGTSLIVARDSEPFFVATSTLSCTGRCRMHVSTKGALPLTHEEGTAGSRYLCDVGRAIRVGCGELQHASARVRRIAFIDAQAALAGDSCQTAPIHRRTHARSRAEHPCVRAVCAVHRFQCVVPALLCSPPQPPPRLRPSVSGERLSAVRRCTALRAVSPSASLPDGRAGADRCAAAAALPTVARLRVCAVGSGRR
jgi:hypothetical protein